MSRFGKGAISILLCSAVSFSAAAAQDSGTSVEQIGPGDDAPMRQIARPQPDSSRADAAVSPSPQIADEEDSARIAPQLTGERRSAPATAQLSDGPRTSEAPQPLSSPAEGRTAEADPVEGDDSCDPAREESRRAECARIVEARADEFNAPRPAQLSPEQRLLLEQRADEDVTGAAGAARRLAATGTTDDSIESFGIASIALRQGLEQPGEEAPPEESGTLPDPGAAFVTAIINQLAGTPPPQ